MDISIILLKTTGQIQSVTYFILLFTKISLLLMKPIIITLGLAGLLLTILPAILLFYGSIEAAFQKQLMGIGMLLWFIAAPIWDRIKKTV
ncbi:MAG: hypothetical protein AAGI07_15370 [Bacteroidota bacterium]